MSMLRLGLTLEAVAHPMYADSLDPRADDASLDYTAVVDFASSVAVGALQQQVRSRSRFRVVR